MSAIVRVHGGLGNQIFQVFYARMYADKYGLTLREVYDGSYYHGFERSPALAAAPEPTNLEKFVSALRIPKFLNKAHLSSERPIRIFGSTYLDAYFQTVTSYAEFGDAEIKKHLRRLAAEFGIRSASNDQTLLHIRLGDFFKTRESALEHAVGRLRRADENSAIMTNDEALFKDPVLLRLLDEKKCKIITTERLEPEIVLRLMATFRQINANDSTLIFWASVLGGCKINLNNNTLIHTHEYFTARYNPRDLERDATTSHEKTHF
ncbi:MAG: hypothetical protein AAB869_04045 [Patescibacteria group bacterium]